MSSRAAGLTTTGGTTAVVRVVHNERDSFARSVDPTAKRHIVHHMRGGTLRRGAWALVDAAYGSETTRDGQCVSYLTFTLGGCGMTDLEAVENCPLCQQSVATFGPSHDGSPRCESGSIASGGTHAHCTCDTCF